MPAKEDKIKHILDSLHLQSLYEKNPELLSNLAKDFACNTNIQTKSVITKIGFYLPDFKAKDFRSERPRRDGVDYQPRNQEPVVNKAGGFMYAAQQGAPKKIAFIEDTPLSPSQEAIVSSQGPSTPVRRADQLSRKGEHYQGPNGTPFKPSIKTSVGTFFIQKDMDTPQKIVRVQKNSSVLKSSPVINALNSGNFRFRVTREEVLSCAGRKRTISQSKVMGFSASDVLDALSEERKSIEAHWAHRRGCWAKGDTNQKNLHFSTAGANYRFYIEIESKVRELLVNGLLEYIDIAGTEQVYTDLNTPRTTTYKVYWGDREEPRIEKTIDHFDVRKPTRQESKLSDAAFLLASSPQQAKRKKLTVDEGKENDAQNATQCVNCKPVSSRPAAIPFRLPGL